MEQMEKIVQQFVEREGLTLKDGLTYAALGLSQAGGKISEIVNEVVISGFGFNDERKDRLADHLGMVAFCYYMLVATSGYTSDEIKSFFANTFLIKTDQVSEEIKASFLELMKHIKADAKLREEKLAYVKKSHTQDTQRNKIQTEPKKLDISNKA